MRSVARPVGVLGAVSILKTDFEKAESCDARVAYQLPESRPATLRDGQVAVQFRKIRIATRVTS